MMRVGSLFSGIGGLDLGLERAGMTVAWQSEIDPYASRVLARHWPHVPNLGDITLIDWSTVEHVDLICGGYPCQPFSLAGERLGSADEDHLWPYMRACLRILRPRFVLIENVAGHLSLGFDDVLGDLVELGFDAEWSTVSACSLGAPHMRRRLFCVAHTNRKGWAWIAQRDMPSSTRQPTPFRHHADRQGVARERTWNTGRPGSLGMAHGLPGWVDRRRVLGNAVVPAVAEYVGRRIMEAAA